MTSTSSESPQAPDSQHNPLQANIEGSAGRPGPGATMRGLPVQSPKVFNLTVLVQDLGSAGVTARAANLSLPMVTGTTIREALSNIVKRAKEVIAENDDSSRIPWIDPPESPQDKETRFEVPLHL